jgi:hypothetical protein
VRFRAPLQSIRIQNQLVRFMVDEGDANFNELLQSINYQERKTFGIII